jgi:AsmA protein
MSDIFVHDHRPRLTPSRRRPAARALILLAFAAAVLIALVIWAVTGPLSPENLRAELERGISRATGRAFKIAGPVHVGLGAAPTLTAEGISLANLPGTSRPEMLTASSVRAEVALLPLLGGAVVIEHATLTNPDIILETAPDGTPNWQMHKLRRAALFDGAAEPADSRGGGGASVELHHIRIEGGTITYRPTVGPEISTQVDTLTLYAESPSSQMRGKLVARSKGVAFTGELQAGSFERLQGGPVTALAGAWPLTITLAGPGASFKIDGGINHPDEMRGYAFLITGNVADMVPLYPWLPPVLALPLHDVNFTARLTDGSNGERHSSALSLQAGPSDLTSAVPGLVLRSALLSAPGPGQQAQLTIDGLFQGAPLRLSATTTQPDTGAGGLPLPLTVTGQAASASLAIRGTVPASWSGLGYDLQVNVHAPNLADLSPLARRALPDVRDIVVDAHVGDAGFRLRGFNLRELTINSSLGDLAGNVTAAWLPVPTLSGTLNAKHVDVDGVLAALATFDTPSSAPEVNPVAVPSGDGPSRLFSDQKLPFGVVHDADADLTLTAGRLTLGGETYRDLQAHVFANGGKLVLNPARVSAPGGVMIGALTLDAGIDPSPVALTLRAPSMSASRVASLLGYPGGATGQMQVDVQVSGVGDTPHALAASANGHVGLAMVNGQFTEALFQNPVGTALTTAGVPPISGNADVRCLALRAQIRQGQGSVEALAVDTSRLALTGTGSFDLDAETVALHLKPVLRVGGTGIASPVLLTGGFGNLKASPDAAMEGGRFGLTIGGPGPDDGACVSQLAQARGGMPGPLPSISPSQSSGPHKKPIDLLRGLFH